MSFDVRYTKEYQELFVDLQKVIKRAEAAEAERDWLQAELETARDHVISLLVICNHAKIEREKARVAEEWLEATRPYWPVPEIKPDADEPMAGTA